MISGLVVLAACTVPLYQNSVTLVHMTFLIVTHIFLSCRNIQEYCTVSAVASANAAIRSLANGSDATTAYAPDEIILAKLRCR
jgi:hypothetical protein